MSGLVSGELLNAIYPLLSLLIMVINVSIFVFLWFSDK